MSKLLIPAQRRERIQEYLAVHRIAQSSELSLLLDVSEATIRRDLEWMENDGTLIRTHGGAILNERLQLEPLYHQRAQKNVEEKRLIGALAASLIESGDIVFINSGTTTTQVIRNIRNVTDITIITNNLYALVEMGEVDFEVILLGGEFQPKSNSVAGRFAIDNLNQVYANKAFIGVDGITLKQGFTVPSIAEAEVLKLMIEHTHGSINIVSDHSKWGVISNFEIAKIDQVHRLITDENFGSSTPESLNDLPIELLVAKSNSSRQVESNKAN